MENLDQALRREREGEQSKERERERENERKTEESCLTAIAVV